MSLEILAEALNNYIKESSGKPGAPPTQTIALLGIVNEHLGDDSIDMIEIADRMFNGNRKQASTFVSQLRSRLPGVPLNIKSVLYSD